MERGDDYSVDPGGNTTILGGPGNDTIVITATSLGGGVVVDGGGGDDTYVVEMGSLDSPVTIHDGAGASRVTINAPPNDSSGPNVLTLTASGLTGDGEMIHLDLGSTLTNLAIDGGSPGKNQLVVVGDPPGPLTLESVLVGTTTAISSADAADFGELLALTATVVANVPGAGTLDGTVTFYDATTQMVLGESDLVEGAAAFQIATLSPGSHTIIATYLGDGDFLASSTTLAVTILPSIYILEPTAGGALRLSGNASVQIAGRVVVDSASPSAALASGNSRLEASRILVTGGARTTEGARFSVPPVTGSPALLDPLAGLAAPSMDGLTVKPAVNLTKGILSIDPGIYSQIKVSGSASLTLKPGAYVIAGGGFTVTGSASVTGSEVLIYNAGGNGGSFGGITLSGNGSVNLTAPTTGRYAGIVIFQSRDNPRAISLSGNAAVGLHGGVIYAPNALFALSGNAQLEGPLVVDQLQLSGNGSSALTAEGNASRDSIAAGELLASDLLLYVDDPSSPLTTEERARVEDAVTGLDSLLLPYGVSVVIVGECDQALANLVLTTASTTVYGGVADGVLGCYADGSEITLVLGWDWYAGSDPAAIGAGQYDFQSILTHELGHALGMGHNPDPKSVMNATLASGVVRRTLAATDLNIGHADYTPEALRAMPPAGAIEAAMLTTWGRFGTAMSNRAEGRNDWDENLRFLVEDRVRAGCSLSRKEDRETYVRDLIFQSLPADANYAAFLDRRQGRIDGSGLEKLDKLSRMLTKATSQEEPADETEASFLDDELLEELASTS